MARPKFTTEKDYKKLEFEDLFDYLNEYGTDEEKAGFKKALYSNKDGSPSVRTTKKGKEEPRENFLNAKLWFCTNFAPELIPVAKNPKPVPKEMKKKLADW